jgi:hypothetical protein
MSASFLVIPYQSSNVVQSTEIPAGTPFVFLSKEELEEEVDETLRSISSILAIPPGDCALLLRLFK